MTKRRTIVKELIDAGWTLRLHTKGPHDKYVKPGERPISVPRHRELDDDTANVIRRQAGLR